MAFTSISVSFLVLGCQLGMLVAAQDQQVQYNQVINLNGDMQLNRLTFPDNSKIETFSQVQKQIIVNQNPNPLSANHVVGSTGQPFVQLSKSSMTIQTNKATDLVGGQIEMSIDPNVLQQMGVSADNTFVAQLSSDRQAWVIMEGIKTVNTTDNTVRMIKMTSLDGEYMAVGRQTVETGNVLTTFNQNQLVQVSGSGIQEVEFTDGFRMSIRASQPMTLKTDVVNGVSSSMTGNIMSVNNYRYKVTSNLAGVATDLNSMVAVVQLPLNAQRIMAMAKQMGVQANSAISLGVAQRVVLQNPGGSNVNGLRRRQDDGEEDSSSSSESESASSAATSSSSSSKSASSAATSASSSSKSASSASSSSSAASSISTVDAAASSSSPSSGSGSSSTSTSAADSATSASPAAADAAASSSTSSAASAASSGSTASSGAGSSTSSQSSVSTAQNAASQPATPSQPQATIPAATQLLLSPTFSPVSAQAIFDSQNNRIAVPVSQIDGEFIVTMGMTGAGTVQVTPAAPGTAGQAQGQPGAAGASTGNSPNQLLQNGTNRTAGSATGSILARQAPAAPPGSIIMTMAQLQEMADRQKNKNAVPVWSMMNEFATQQASLSQAGFAKKREPVTGYRAVPFTV